MRHKLYVRIDPEDATKRSIRRTLSYKDVIIRYICVFVKKGDGDREKKLTFCLRVVADSGRSSEISLLGDAGLFTKKPIPCFPAGDLHAGEGNGCCKDREERQYKRSKN